MSIFYNSKMLKNSSNEKILNFRKICKFNCVDDFSCLFRDVACHSGKSCTSVVLEYVTNVIWDRFSNIQFQFSASVLLQGYLALLQCFLVSLQGYLLPSSGHLPRWWHITSLESDSIPRIFGATGIDSGNRKSRTWDISRIGNRGGRLVFQVLEVISTSCTSRGWTQIHF